MAMQSYIESFFKEDGPNRSLLSVAAPAELNYVLGSIDPEDKTKRKLLLARFYKGVVQQVPAILIIDSGFIPHSSGIGKVQSGTMVNGKLQTTFAQMATVPLIVAVVAGDDTTVDNLFGALNLIFGELLIKGSGHYIAPTNPDEAWVARLPLEYSASGLERIPITEDNVDSIYAATFDIAVEFESVFSFEEDIMTDMQDARNAVVNDSDLASSLPPVITVASQIHLNQPANISIQRLRAGHRIVLTDYSIALLDLEQWKLYPRKLGRFKVQVLDLTQRSQDVREGLAPIVSSEKEIEVIL